MNNDGVDTLSLKDLDFVEKAPAIAADSEKMSIPAALCDDLLLEEIANIPDKMGFKIGEVADLLDIKQYVLRYWETEFEILKPKKASNNQRMYTKKDVENAFLVRKLLHRDRFSIEGARGALRELKNYVKKERNWSQVNENMSKRLETFHDRAQELATDLQRVKSLFR
ncbi:MAG: MerR family transcriptional regulator [Bdellovibrionota bacterium]